MSRSGYSEDCDNWALIKWRGQVASAIRGRRGQRLLGDLLDALEAMPVKRLFADVFDDGAGCVCALGAVGRLRGVDTTDIDPEDYCANDIAPRLDIAHQLAAEVMFVNDEGRARTPEERWAEVYGWALRRLRAPRLPFAPHPSVAFLQERGDTAAATYPHCIRRPVAPDECEYPCPKRLTTTVLFTDRCAAPTTTSGEAAT